MIFYGLLIILLIVLFLPFLVKKIEQELEVFLFVMGSLAVTLTGQWHIELIREALAQPVKITLAVFVAGGVFQALQETLARNVNKLSQFLGVKFFIFLVIILLGFLSSIITAIIAGLVLVEIVHHLKLDRRHEIVFVVLACFAIGFGAVLTPIGEPLSTITVAKLKGAPYFAGFWFLLHHLGWFIVPSVIGFGLLGAVLIPARPRDTSGFVETQQEQLDAMILRAAKVYLFIVALVFLGQGFKPLVDTYVVKISSHGLYWLNILSAILDNATLAAAEISPIMSLAQIKAALLGLVIAGGMLIPGNIPNIIAAGRLKIKSSEWARWGLPLGLAVMAVFFLALIMV